MVQVSVCSTLSGASVGSEQPYLGLLARVNSEKSGGFSFQRNTNQRARKISEVGAAAR